MDERKKELESLLEMAASLTDILEYLRQRGVYDHFKCKDGWEVFVTKEVFREVFGDVEPDGRFLRARLNGVLFAALVE